MGIDWIIVLRSLSWLYAIFNLALAIFAFNMFLMLALAVAFSSGQEKAVDLPEWVIH